MNLVCSECGKEYGNNEKINKCECGGVLEIEGKDVSFPGPTAVKIGICRP